MANPKDVTGLRFGRWTVLRMLNPRKLSYHKIRYECICKCDCGVERTVDKALLLKGKSKSCGCYKKDYARQRRQDSRIYIAENVDTHRKGMLAIYTLADPITQEIVYVGCTKDPNRRLRKHVDRIKYPDRKIVGRKDIWIESLLASGRMPILSVLDYCKPNEFEFWEQYWIAQFKAWGFNLLNYSIGGKGTKGYSASKKPVLKVSVEGIVIQEYSSAKEAAIKNNITPTGMGGRIKRRSIVNESYFKYKNQ